MVVTRKRKYNENLKDDEGQILSILENDSQPVLVQQTPGPTLVLVNPELINPSCSSTAEASTAATSPVKDVEESAISEEVTATGSSGNQEDGANSDDRNAMEGNAAEEPLLIDDDDGDDYELQKGTSSNSDSEDEVVEVTSPAKKRKLDSRGRGKPMDPVWFNFHKSLDGKKSLCNFCGLEVSSKAVRLRSHLGKCDSYAGQSSVPGRKSVPGKSPVVASPARSILASPAHSLLATPARSSSLSISRRNLEAFVSRVGKVEQSQINMEVGKYIYAMNLPFSHVGHPAFDVKTLRPGCQLPSRKSIGGSILNSTYDEVHIERNKAIFGKQVTILQDGWKSRTFEPVIAHSIICEGKSHFLEAQGTGYRKKKSSFLAKLLIDQIEKVTQAGANVAAVVTDNCNQMEKMKRIVRERFPQILTYGCHPHLLNLVGKRLTPDDVTSRINTVHTYFRNHDAASGVLKTKKVGRPVLPSNVRWNSWMDCLEYYIKNQTKLLEVAREPDASVEDAEVLETLNDGVFYEEVRVAVNYMKPIQLALDQLQREDATLADGVHQWLGLRDVLNIRDAEDLAYFNTQFDRALPAVGIASYMVNPKYRGERLTPQLLAIGNQFLTAQSPMFMIYAAQPREKNRNFFPPEMFGDELLEKCSNVDWWTSQRALGKLTGSFIDLAVKLVQLPSGSAEIERHFSTLGNILNVRRTRLGIEKASKLGVIYTHSNKNPAPTDDTVDWESV